MDPRMFWRRMTRRRLLMQVMAGAAVFVFSVGLYTDLLYTMSSWQIKRSQHINNQSGIVSNPTFIKTVSKVFRMSDNLTVKNVRIKKMTSLNPAVENSDKLQSENIRVGNYRNFTQKPVNLNPNPNPASFAFKETGNSLLPDGEIPTQVNSSQGHLKVNNTIVTIKTPEISEFLKDKRSEDKKSEDANLTQTRFHTKTSNFSNKTKTSSTFLSGQKNAGEKVPQSPNKINHTIIFNAAENLKNLQNQQSKKVNLTQESVKVDTETLQSKTAGGQKHEGQHHNLTGEQKTQDILKVNKTVVTSKTAGNSKKLQEEQVKERRHEQSNLKTTIASVNIKDKERKIRDNQYSQNHLKPEEIPGSFHDKNLPAGHQTDSRPNTRNLTINSGPRQVHKTAKAKEIQQQSASTTMTFDTNLIVQCKDSPFIICQPPAQPVHKNHTFRIVALHRPGWMGQASLRYHKCPYNKCVADGESEDKITEHTDLVHIHAVALNSKKHHPPAKRWPHQLYATSTWESPTTTHADFLYNSSSEWNNLFNVTMTYRTDSDVFIPYSRLTFQPLPLKKRPNYYEIAKKKTKTAAWIVSNCKAPSKRLEYAQEMQKYVDVDIWGRCGKPCKLPKRSPTCVDDFPSAYKFYLAFESSLCTDYVTEKFFKAFSHGMHVIPVVRGRIDYDKYFANFTYVNAAHFKTAKDLALHLKDLASDLKTYSKYLEYKDLYVAGGGTKSDAAACQLCEYLHTRREVKPKVYNMKQWMGDGHCIEPDDIV